MARAKRTDRADARRRYRQTPYAEPEESQLDSPVTPPAQKGSAPATERPGIASAFRKAYHSPNLRADLASLPWLLRTRAFLVPLALVLGGLIAVAAAPSNTITNLVFQAMIVPPAMAPIFIAGFFAKRASYLLGLIIAIVDVGAYAVYIYSVAPGLTAQPIDASVQLQAVYSAISVGPLSGILFAGAAAWYRRFLALSNAGAAQRAKARQQQRSRSGRPARG